MTIQAAGYIVVDKNRIAIQGIGKTEDEAWNDVVNAISPFQNDRGDGITEQEARDEQFRIFPATAALIQDVEKFGGRIAWVETKNLAMTHEEYEEYRG